MITPATAWWRPALCTADSIVGETPLAGPHDADQSQAEQSEADQRRP
jgi:hypothetical protein